MSSPGEISRSLRSGERGQAFVALGTNLGDRLLNLNEARRHLASLGELRRGPVLETPALLPPEDPTPQPDYLNTVDELTTSLSPRALFTELKRIERHMGRRVTTRWAPRIIDLDLILFGEVTMNTEGLTIPHPRMHERRFVLEPLAHLAPELRHPLTGQSTRALLKDVLRRAS
ncbi:MAG: 2-amino-4-hydroxy-6-hydroxymethyldihydropteridine diphosphokinase [Archangium gephyra]|uniref:2-amino-4-hydroxy-6-hydroxymethyldihydropteridine pyrophosphokinase n=1 Tax=Archangium gephyra TaxID=48 RepID=A0A2W5T195_9BACT|nr:MAG: 2-amino-4-hydroxy-6-hydroxymethyldihydropteridine diphosphokinase [Archangium gephyra]